MKLSSHSIKIILFLILLLAAFLRFYKLGQVPPSLEWDEVAIGYDAYSVLKTGRDQFGQFLPLTFRSIDDYKPPIYEYLAIPSIAIFGLNEFSVRFPSAIFGTLAVLLTYFLVREILGGQIISLLATFFLAISPWHLQFCRAAFEVNLSVTLLIGATLSFLTSLKKPTAFILSSFLFGLGFFTYHSARVVFPLIFIFLLFNFRKSIPKGKILKIGLAIYIVLSLTFLPIMFSKEAQMRLRVTNISNNLFLQKTTLDKIQKDLKVDGRQENDFIYRIFHGKKAILLTTLFDNYFSHFSPDFLFVKADVPLHHAPDFGLLYRFDAIFLLIGFVAYFSKYLNKKSLLLPVWFFLAPLPAAVTLQVPHAVRSELFLPTFQIFTAIGLYTVGSSIFQKSRGIFWLFLGASAIFLFYNFAVYLHQYYVHLPKEYAKFWLYGRKEAAEISERLKSNYPKVIVSTKLEMPHLFWLFYTHYDPKRYLEEGGTLSGGWAEEGNKFDNYEFRKPSETKKEAALYFTTLNEKFVDGRTVKEIRYPDGEVGILIWEY